MGSMAGKVEALRAPRLVVRKWRRFMVARGNGLEWSGLTGFFDEGQDLLQHGRGLALSPPVWQIPDMSATLTHRFTVEEYYRMAETGILKPDARVELIEGEIVDMMPAGPFHSGVVYELVKTFNSLAADRWAVGSQGPLHVDDHNELEPDVMLLRPPGKQYKQTHPTPEDVFLVIEVSDSTLIRDQMTKLPLYARAGIEEVWILNVPQKQLEVYRQPHFTGYEFKQIVREGHFSPAAFPDALVNVTEILN
jgi:Uma2 family endonuclease